MYGVSDCVCVCGVGGEWSVCVCMCRMEAYTAVCVQLKSSISLWPMTGSCVGKCVCTSQVDCYYIVVGPWLCIGLTVILYYNIIYSISALFSFRHQLKERHEKGEEVSGILTLFSPIFCHFSLESYNNPFPHCR